MAALKHGWDAIASEFPDVDITYFAAKAPLLEELHPEGNKLVATTAALQKRFETTSGGLIAIENTYDAYLICGLGLSFQIAVQIQKVLRVGEERGNLPAGRTKAVLPDMIAESVSNVRAVRILDMLRQITDAPITLVPQPLRGEENDKALKSSANADGIRDLQSVFQSAVARLAAKRDASFLPQPAETISEALPATKSRYANAPARLSAENPESDHAHMNGEYGAIVLRGALRSLGNAPIRNTAR